MLISTEFEVDTIISATPNYGISADNTLRYLVPLTSDLLTWTPVGQPLHQVWRS